MSKKIFLSLLALPMFVGCGLFGIGTMLTANVRVIHLSPDAPNVDVCANGDVLFSNAAFPSATDYANVPAGDYDVAVIPTGSGCSTMGVIEAMLMFAGGSDTTIIAANTLDNIEPVVLNDDNSDRSPNMVRVRFFHGSPDAPTIDVTLEDGTTLFDDVSFKEVTEYIEVAAGTVTLQVRDQAGVVTLLEVPDVTLDAGAVVTVYAHGFAVGTPSLGALITTD